MSTVGNGRKPNPEKAQAAWAAAWQQLELRCGKCGKPYKGNMRTPCPNCGEKIK
jgi:rubrerythrin